MINIAETFAKLEDEKLSFKQIQDPPSDRSDLCAFILLDALVPGESHIVACAEHDEIWLDVDLDRLAEAATEEDIRTLRCCGVHFYPDEGLHMFV